jgi:hypothetical protein
MAAVGRGSASLAVSLPLPHRMARVWRMSRARLRPCAAASQRWQAPAVPYEDSQASPALDLVDSCGDRGTLAPGLGGLLCDGRPPDEAHGALCQPAIEGLHSLRATSPLQSVQPVHELVRGRAPPGRASRSTDRAPSSRVGRPRVVITCGSAMKSARYFVLDNQRGLWIGSLVSVRGG